MKNIKKIEKGIIVAIVIITTIFFTKIIYFQLNDNYPFKITYSQKENTRIAKRIVKNERKRVVFSKKNSKKNKTINLTVEKKKININSASMTQLITIKGIGKKTAEKIIKYRNDVGYFKNKREVLKIKGIGEKKFEKMESQIIIE